MKCEYESKEPFSVGGLNRKDDTKYRANYDAIFRNSSSDDGSTDDAEGPPKKKKTQNNP